MARKTVPEKKAVDKKKVFIVHGHNDALKTEVVRTVELMGLKASMGWLCYRFLIDKKML